MNGVQEELSSLGLSDPSLGPTSLSVGVGKAPGPEWTLVTLAARKGHSENLDDTLGW